MVKTMPRTPTHWTPGKIAELRSKLGMKQAEAADKVGVGQAVWSAWEHGHRSPSRQSSNLLDRLNKTLGKNRVDVPQK